MGDLAGVLCLNRSDDAARLLRMVTSAINKRTRAQFSAVDGGFIALALGRFANSVEAKSARPIVLPNGSILAWNGRVDERKELADALGMASGTLEGLSDADLIGRAWLKWRGDFWRHVVGDFALAVWEPKSETLSLFRDRIGVRPLYTVRTPTLLAFASEHTALLALPGIDAAPNEDRIANLLVPGFGVGAAYGTWFRAIDRVDAASALEVSRSGTFRSYTYWYPEVLPELQLGDERAYIEAFQEVLSRAVRSRLPTTGKAAVQLSGGIDSASLLAAAGSFLRLSPSNPLGAISVLPDGSISEESTNIRKMLSSVGGLATTFPEHSFTTVLDAFDRHLWERPDPVTASAPLVVLCAMAAADAGVGVLMDGLDGDMLMAASYGYIVRLAARGRLTAAWREAGLAARHHSNLWGRSRKQVLQISMRSWLGEVAAKIEPTKSRRWRMSRAMFEKHDVLLTQEFQMQCRERFEEISIRLNHELKRYAELFRPGLTAGSGVYGRVAAEFGVESRHPWLDQRLVEFALRLPEHIKVQQGWTKYVVRRACESALGDDIVWHRGKEHLGARVLVQQMSHSRRLHETLEGSLEVLSPYINIAELVKLQTSWTRDSLHTYPDPRLYYVAALGGWLRRTTY